MQDDRCLRTIALLVDTPGYNKLMLSKSDAEHLSVEIRTDAEETRKQHEQMEEQCTWARMLEQQNKLASEREKRLQAKMEEQARKLQEQTEQNKMLQEQLVAAMEGREQQCQLVKILQIELDMTKTKVAANGPGNDTELVQRFKRQKTSP